MPAGQCARRDEGATVAHLCLSVASDGREIFWIYYWKRKWTFSDTESELSALFLLKRYIVLQAALSSDPTFLLVSLLLVHGFFVFSGNSPQNFEMLDKKLGPRMYAHLWQQRMRGVVGRGFRRGVLKCHPEDSVPPPPPRVWPARQM